MDHIIPLHKIAAPYGREVALERVEYESGMVLLRIKIREGRRHTILEIDRDTAWQWGSGLLAFADSVPSDAAAASDA
jgi:hypothetical protein